MKEYTLEKYGFGHLLRDAQGRLHGLVRFDSGYWCGSAIQYNSLNPVDYAFPYRRYRGGSLGQWADVKGANYFPTERAKGDSKERLIQRMLDMPMPTEAEARERFLIWDRERRAKAAAAKREIDERAERESVMLEGYRSLSARSDLTNIERAALDAMGVELNLNWPKE